MTKRYIVARRFLIFWTLFISIGAIGGSLCMLIDPSGKFMGMDAMLPYFQVLPFSDKLFQNFVFSGIMLLIVNGITNLVSACLLFAKKKIGIILGMIFGITLMLWIIIQFVIFPFNFMSTAFFIIGLLQFITGYVCLVGYYQSNFTFNQKDYTNIGKDNSKVVIYFSRLGYTKKLAYETANNLGAEIIEIKPKEKISGDRGFWWCGRFGMHKWGMPIEEINFDPARYNEIIICSPTWVFSLSAPVRQFCQQYSGRINNVSYYITHFMGAKLNNVAKEMDKLLNTNYITFRSFQCHFGKLKEIKK